MRVCLFELWLFGLFPSSHHLYRHGNDLFLPLLESSDRLCVTHLYPFKPDLLKELGEIQKLDGGI